MSIQTSVKGNSRLIPVLVLVLAILTVIDDFRGWRLLLIGLAGTWVFCRWWAFSLVKNLRVHREIRYGWAQVGDRLEQRFTMVNDSHFPAVWLELEDHSDLPGLHTNLATGIGGHNFNQWRIRGVCQQRGLFTLGPTTIHSSDPLGLFQITIHDPSHVNLLVTPPIVPLPQIEVASGGRAGEGRPRLFVQEQTVSSSGTRPYLPGDSLRQMHWLTTARRDALHVRTFENRPSGDWWILVDFDRSVQIGEGPESTMEYAVILAASLADRGLRLGRAVGLAAYGDQITWLPPRHGDGQRWEILEALALLKPGELPLERLLDLLEPKLTADTSLVIITPNQKESWLRSVLPLIWKGAVPTVLMLDRASFGELESSVNATAGLIQWGIHYEKITSDLLDQPEARPGHEGEENWRITPTGRAVLIKPPRRSSWRVFP
jgi:uncharacterized protein (DUF58 family)